MKEDIQHIVEALPTISLEEMSAIRLMNRTDKKYIATLDQLQQFLVAVQGKYYVQDLDGILLNPYHTVYMDTQDTQMYITHHNGKAARQKVRVRTYVHSGITFFEIKNKNNHGRTKKKRIQVQGMETLEQEGANDLLHKYARYTLQELEPTMENNFERITLVNYDKTERLTIDMDLLFHHLQTDITRDMKNFVVIELKRDGNVPSPALAILRDLHIKPSGFSKYCMGTAFTNPDIKQNNFKERIQLINKLIQK